MSPRRPELSFSLAWFIRGGPGVGVGGTSSAGRRTSSVWSNRCRCSGWGNVPYSPCFRNGWLRRVLTGRRAARKTVVSRPVLRVRLAAVRRAGRLLAIVAGQRWFWWKRAWHAPVMAIVHPVVGNSPCGIFCSHLIDQAHQDWTPLHQFCDVYVFRVSHGVLQEGVYGVLENGWLLDGPLILPAPFRAHRRYVGLGLRQNAFLAALRAPESRFPVLFRPIVPS